MWIDEDQTPRWPRNFTALPIRSFSKRVAFAHWPMGWSFRNRDRRHKHQNSVIILQPLKCQLCWSKLGINLQGRCKVKSSLRFPAGLLGEKGR